MAKRYKKSTGIGPWLQNAATPIFVLDAERRIRGVNAGFQQLTGWPPGEILGETCHYGSVSELAGATALAASICPPPEVFAGESAAVPASVVHREGHAIPRTLQFFPFRDETEAIAGILGLALPPLPASPQQETSPARRLHAELAALRSNLRSRFGPNTIVARSVAMQRVLAQLELAQNSEAAVLLTGPAGTGKEHLARVIHLSGPGRANWFVPLDCRRLDPEGLDRVWNRLLESLHPERGPAAGSPQPGTVWISHVELLPRDLQERLVALFAAGEGKSRPEVRLLSGSCLSVPKLESQQNLRPDFFALISPLAIELPPLEKRPDDLPVLAQHFLEELNRQESKQVGGFDEQVWPLFTRYQWPGNLDELAAVVREARAHAAEMTIRVHDLPYRFQTALAAQELPPPNEPRPMLLDPLLTKVETRLITLALERSRNNKSKAAELLGINRARLLRRIEQLKIGSNEPAEAEPETAEEPEPDLGAEPPGTTDDADPRG